jgi:hypothetical protein
MVKPDAHNVFDLGSTPSAPTKDADSHSDVQMTPYDVQILVCWLGDDTEVGLTQYYEIKEVGWYWMISEFLPAHGPFNTSKEAYDDCCHYISEK